MRACGNPRDGGTRICHTNSACQARSLASVGLPNEIAAKRKSVIVARVVPCAPSAKNVARVRTLGYGPSVRRRASLGHKVGKAHKVADVEDERSEKVLLTEGPPLLVDDVLEYRIRKNFVHTKLACKRQARLPDRLVDVRNVPAIFEQGNTLK